MFLLAFRRQRPFTPALPPVKATKTAAKHIKNQRRTVAGGSLLQTGIYFVWRAKIAGLFTGLPQILAAVNRYDMFIVFFPVLSALGIVYYGVFNGTLQTTPICISMLFTAASYLLAKAALVPELGNSGLWLAFLVFYVARSGFLLIFVPSLLKKFPYRT